MSEPFSPRSSKRSRISLEPSGEIGEIPQSLRMSEAHPLPGEPRSRSVYWIFGNKWHSGTKIGQESVSR